MVETTGPAENASDILDWAIDTAEINMKTARTDNCFMKEGLNDGFASI